MSGNFQPVAGTALQFGAEEWSRPVYGAGGASIVVVCEPPDKNAAKLKKPMGPDHLSMFYQAATSNGFGDSDFFFIGLCPFMPDAIRLSNSAKKIWEFIEPHTEALNTYLRTLNPRMIITLGALATRAVFGRNVKITTVAGQPEMIGGIPVIPLFSPSFIKRVPEHGPLWHGHIHSAYRFVANGFQSVAAPSLHYEWRTDIQDILDNPPRMISVDTETTGLIWWERGTRPITVQIAVRPGVAYAIPVDEDYWSFEPGQRDRVVAQLRALLENPRVLKCGFNLKFDNAMLRNIGINVKGWFHDAQLMTAFIDENMMRKDLASVTKVYAPEIGGYSDLFDSTVDKAKMIEVAHGPMLLYGCGDADATLRVTIALDRLLRADRDQWRCYRRVQFPALITFMKTVETFGIRIDQAHLGAFTQAMITERDTIKRRLEASIPRAIKRRAINEAFAAKGKTKKLGKYMSLTRPDFIRDVLFDPQGFALDPKVFTASTRELEIDERIASTSAKDHMPYLLTAPGVAGQFVADYIDHTKLEKLVGTYLEGFTKYIAPDGCVHPFYKLHNTNTLRSASEYPNGQNFPKRSRWAKEYNKIFIPREGFIFVDCDLSQVELRVIAWMSGDPEMLRIYGNNGDIHTEMAMVTGRLNQAQWDAFDAKTKKSLRTKAKAINFGFCLIGSELVLTDRGLVPLKDVKLYHRLWDGVEWVNHEGVVFMGEKEVITYDGVTGTPDHEGYTTDGRKVPIGQLASEVPNGCLAVGEIDGLPVRYEAFDRRAREAQQGQAVCRGEMPGLWEDELGSGGQHSREEISRLLLHAGPPQVLRSEGKDPWGALRCYGSEVPPGHPCVLPQLQRQGDRSAIREPGALHQVGTRDVAGIRLQELGLRSGGQQRPLFEGESATGHEVREPSQHATIKKARVYDIRNAGPRHRFTVSGKIVSNCYGMGWRKFIIYAKTEYNVVYTEKEAQEVRRLYFEKFAALPEWHKRMKDSAFRNTYVKALHFATRHLPSIHSNDDSMKALAERQAVNAPVQRFGSDLGLIAMHRFSSQADPDQFRIIGFIHDALVMEARIDRAEEGASALRWCMETAPLPEWFGLTPPIPLSAEPGIGTTLGTMEERPDIPAIKPSWWNDNEAEASRRYLDLVV